MRFWRVASDIVYSSLVAVVQHELYHTLCRLLWYFNVTSPIIISVAMYRSLCVGSTDRRDVSIGDVKKYKVKWYHKGV